MEYAALVESLRDGSLIAFVGAGASRSYTDVHTGRSYAGLPSGREIVKSLAERRAFIDSSLEFTEACFLLKNRESRAELEKFLLEAIDRPVIQPLPAYVILANLPFAAFITTNYDRLIEQALSDAKRSPHAIIDDDDVSRLRPHHVPVLKLHGCVSRPSSMIAAEDEYRLLSERQPITEALLKTQLANKVVLFLGFALDDFDFRVAYDLVKDALGNRTPRSYAVVQSASEYRRCYWESRGINLIEADLTDFVRGLLRASVGGETPAVYHPNEDWINNAFFESLHRIRTLPSETQVIDAFLVHLLEEMGVSGFSLDDVVSRAEKAASLVLARRGNFEALRRVSKSVLTAIQEKCVTSDQAEALIQRVIADRQTTSRAIAQLGLGLIDRGDSMLVYSQSVRVIQLLRGVPRGVQDTCHIYVAECRPKSPLPFQDALAVCEALAPTGYEITIVPDAAIGNLIGRRQVHKVFMGAHEIFVRDGEPQSFVNTCGSQVLMSAARDAQIPVFVVAEALKLVDVESVDLAEISFDQEEDIFSPIAATLSDLKASGQRVSALNIGYDLCPMIGDVRVITEESGT